LSDKNYFSERSKKLSVSNKTEFSSFPKDAYIEVTNACNHACVFCANPKMKRSTKTLDFNLFKKFLSKAVEEGLEEVGLYSTGEPFMTKNIDEYILAAKKAGIKRVYITTNGALASLNKVKKCLKNGLDSIKFSINAGSEDTYKIIHGFDDFKRVIKNLIDIYDFKKKNNLSLQLLCSFVYNKLTKNEIETFKQKYGKFFDEDILFIPVMNQGGRTSELIDKFNHTDDIKLKGEKIEYKPCEMIWNRFHLTSEGYFTACCSDYENDLVFDKFDETKKISDQFNNQKIRYLRKKHLNNDLKDTICENCIYNSNNTFSKLSFLSNNEKINETKFKNHQKRGKYLTDYNE
jgi:MoaA/NifB/PqqE/SkfB family radical SAM enzyme